MDAMQVFHDIAAAPQAYAREWKARTGGKVVGTFCSYAPEELILAAGALGYRIVGGSGAISKADAHFAGLLLQPGARRAGGRPQPATGFPGRHHLSPYLRFHPAALGFVAHECPNRFSSGCGLAGEAQHRQRPGVYAGRHGKGPLRVGGAAGHNHCRRQSPGGHRHVQPHPGRHADPLHHPAGLPRCYRRPRHPLPSPGPPWSWTATIF